MRLKVCLAVLCISVSLVVVVAPASASARTCALGGTCKVGDVGPGGGTVVYDAGEVKWWGRYLEALPLTKGRGLPWSVKTGESVYEGGFGAGGDAVLLVDAKAVAHVRVERSVPIVFSMSGESFDIGMDTGAPVGKYPHVYRFTGEIRGVTLERLDEPNPEIAARIAEGEFRASIATQ